MKFNSPYRTPIKGERFRPHAHAKAQHKRYRSIGTQTKTSTKKEEKMHGDDIHSGITQTGYKIVVNPKVPKKTDPGKAWQYLEGATKVLYGDPGIQATTTLSCIGTIPQHINTSTTAATDVGADPTLSCVAYCKQNPNNSTSTASLFQGGVVMPVTTKYLYKSVGYTLRVANLTNLAAEVEIYVLKSKCNHNYFPDALWTQCAKNHGLNRTSAATTGGGGSTTTGTIGYSSPFLIDSTPLVFKEFKKLWSPIKIHNVNLGGSAAEKIHFSITMNQTVDIAKYVSLNNGMTADYSTWNGSNTSVKFPTGSLAVMVIQRGSVVRDTTAPGPSQGCATPGRTEIGFYMTKHSYFQTIAKTTQQIDPEVAAYNTSAPSFANAQAVNIVDVVSSTVVS